MTDKMASDNQHVWTQTILVLLYFSIFSYTYMIGITFGNMSSMPNLTNGHSNFQKNVRWRRKSKISDTKGWHKIHMMVQKKQSSFDGVHNTDLQYLKVDELQKAVQCIHFLYLNNIPRNILN